ncbi:sensor histidine kinase [Acrocarpospora catenulata]|uniref:sensor histidine kinase n=1 Tax=Acrocarpospora catenulata TaxID=2836182 RepID=UPI001BDB2B88|nr:HAMP domain-containing sensor histidine kinase [Acrocarpospora catenulata]
MTTNHRNSITARITLFTGAVAAILSVLLATVLLIAIYRFASSSLLEDIRDTGGRVATKVEQHQQDILRSGNLAHTARVPDIQILDQDRHVVESTEPMRGKPPMASFPPGAQASEEAVVCGGTFGAGRCDIVVAQSAKRPEGLWTIYTAAPAIPPWTDTELAALIAGCAIALAASVTYLGHRIVTASLRPVRAIRTELNEINASSPGRRVPAPLARDEIHALAESINLTLTRLEGAMEQQRHFASDASHDLKSPITAMRAEVEDALMAPGETSVPALGNTILASLDRLESIVYDLLTLARLDAGPPPSGEMVDLAELVRQECDRRHQGAKAIVCHLRPGVVVRGERLRLARLLTNLVDNAERYARTTITITVEETGQEHADERFPHGLAVLEVADDGPGIDPDKRELAFQRFARLNPSHSRGTGLGLAIARQIAEGYGGSLRVEDSDRGARFVLRLPRYPEESPSPESA